MPNRKNFNKKQVKVGRVSHKSNFQETLWPTPDRNIYNRRFASIRSEINRSRSFHFHNPRATYEGFACMFRSVIYAEKPRWSTVNLAGTSLQLRSELNHSRGSEKRANKRTHASSPNLFLRGCKSLREMEKLSLGTGNRSLEVFRFGTKTLILILKF